LLADKREALSIQSAADELGLAASTTHRLLNSLRDQGFVAYVPATRSYTIGPEFLRVAARVTSGASVVDLAQKSCDELAGRYDETILFASYLPKQRAMCFSVRADGKKRLQYVIDMHTPLSLIWGASGKAILAHLSSDEIRQIYDDEKKSPATGAPKPPFKTFCRTLAEVRERGFVVTGAEKLPDARGVAAPVFAPGGVVGSLTLTSPLARFHHDPNVVGQDIASAAANLSRQIGGDVP
jgi:DNA-binding IclR family transcriptional regulator